MTMVCHKCWNPINWKESFNKYGHGDGDDCVHTPQVAAHIRKLGFEPTMHDVALHNPVLVRIERVSSGDVVWGDGLIVAGEPLLVGEVDPSDVLPRELLDALDKHFGRGEFFG
ncbi:hypothetical protein [Burkholderia cenocepacia]|uniref:hypothetical protein n=1 Tax=Burkholderia cenocepacia TaxID=95486 RepID=UPI00076142FB|nr:hypothetical protein [Burkholderia cenocepacia]KWU26310.1 hypothetical protein AS149_25300 [Burkholderia cenocepacia]